MQTDGERIPNKELDEIHLLQVRWRPWCFVDEHQQMSKLLGARDYITHLLNPDPATAARARAILFQLGHAFSSARCY